MWSSCLASFSWCNVFELHIILGYETEFYIYISPDAHPITWPTACFFILSVFCVFLEAGLRGESNMFILRHSIHTGNGTNLNYAS